MQKVTNSLRLLDAHRFWIAFIICIRLSRNAKMGSHCKLLYTSRFTYLFQ